MTDNGPMKSLACAHRRDEQTDREFSMHRSAEKMLKRNETRKMALLRAKVKFMLHFNRFFRQTMAEKREFSLFDASLCGFSLPDT